MNVGFVSLGCSKNLIDTEATIGKFKENNFNIVNDEKKADIIVVNTCGFIDSAKEEAINTILEMAEYKKGRCKYKFTPSFLHVYTYTFFYLNFTAFFCRLLDCLMDLLQ